MVHSYFCSLEHFFCVLEELDELYPPFSFTSLFVVDPSEMGYDSLEERHDLYKLPRYSTGENTKVHGVYQESVRDH